jgi:monothiol glutaredoxin
LAVPGVVGRSVPVGSIPFPPYPTHLRQYSTPADGSHSDFAPKAREPTEQDLELAIEEMNKDIKENRVVLFMKGEPKNPQCGFSAKVVQILAAYGVKYVAYNVLQDPLIRAGVKKISNWPTIPQLYVDGEFVGGCDILTELHNNDELKDILKADSK